MNAARRNALRLIADAQILFNAKRYPTAASVAALSIEESGKIPILRSLVGATKSSAIAAAWKSYRDHRSKNGMWIMDELVKSGAYRLDEFNKIMDRDSEHTEILDSVKQLGFYTGCHGTSIWSEPDKVIGGDLAEALIATAKLLAPKKDVTLRELDLWAQLVAPYIEDPQHSRHALMSWATAVHAEGLTDLSPQDFARFIFGDHEEAECVTAPPKVAN
jgi:AbiV family abortive infection protein